MARRGPGWRGVRREETSPHKGFETPWVGGFLTPFWHPFGLLWASFWPRLERFWLHFRSFCLLGAALAPLWVPFSVILHRLAFILERFGLHPLFLAPQSAKYCKIDLGNQISYKVLLAILSSTGPSGGTIAASNREESCL